MFDNSFVLFSGSHRRKICKTHNWTVPAPLSTFCFVATCNKCVGVLPCCAWTPCGIITPRHSGWCKHKTWRCRHRYGGVHCCGPLECCGQSSAFWRFVFFLAMLPVWTTVLLGIRFGSFFFDHSSSFWIMCGTIILLAMFEPFFIMFWTTVLLNIHSSWHSFWFEKTGGGAHTIHRNIDGGQPTTTPTIAGTAARNGRDGGGTRWIAGAVQHSQKSDCYLPAHHSNLETPQRRSGRGNERLQRNVGRGRRQIGRYDYCCCGCCCCYSYWYYYM